VLSELTMPSGVPIKKVRIIKPEKTIRRLRKEGSLDQSYVKPGSTHHLCIFEWEEKGKIKREPVFVTMLEATERLKQHEQIIQRIPPVNHDSIPPDAKFVMSLSGRELVLADVKGKEILLTFKTAASTTGQLWFASVTDARKSTEYSRVTFSANTLDARKVTVDPLGRIRWAND